VIEVGGFVCFGYVTFVTTVATLTPADQGVVVVGVGGSIVLPASPTLGTVYKFIALLGTFSLDTNGALVGGLGSGVIQVGVGVFTIMAFDATTWAIIDLPQATDTYNVARVYPKGARVLDNGVDVCISLVDDNLGNPVSDQTKWYRIAQKKTAVGSIASTDLTFTGTPPSGTFGGSYRWSTGGDVAVLVIKLAFQNAGAGITRVDITSPKVYDILNGLADLGFNPEEDTIGDGFAHDPFGYQVGSLVRGFAAFSPSNQELVTLKDLPSGAYAYFEMRFVLQKI
jgi:hypothetical protein